MPSKAVQVCVLYKTKKVDLKPQKPIHVNINKMDWKKINILQKYSTSWTLFKNKDMHQYSEIIS